MFSFSKEKKRKEQPKLHDLAFLLILRTLLQPALFSTVAAREAAPSYIYPQSYCLSSPTKQKLKKCSTTRKGPHLPIARKFSFPKTKTKKRKRKKRDLTTSTSHSFSHCKRCSLRFFSAAAAREAREAALRAASRFSSLLAAASRFCCSIHGNCSASRTKSQILQPCDPGLRLIKDTKKRSKILPRKPLLNVHYTATVRSSCRCRLVMSVQERVALYWVKKTLNRALLLVRHGGEGSAFCAPGKSAVSGRGVDPDCPCLCKAAQTEYKDPFEMDLGDIRGRH